MKNATRMSVFAAILCMVSSWGHAASSNPMKEIFNGMMTNSTDATTFESARRIGATGGGYSVRIPRSTPQFINVNPPRASAGCGGADFFLGSFSIINKDELVQVMRGIANGAAAYAFSVGMEAVCPTCIKTMENYANQLNALNKELRDSCKATLNYLSNPSPVNDQLSKIASENALFKPMAVNLGLVKDAGAVGNKPNTTGMIADSNPEAVKNESFNATWDALDKMNVKSWTIEGYGNYDWRSILMSLMGTVIYVWDDSLNQGDAGYDGAFQTQSKPSTMRLKDLVEGADQITFLVCADPSDASCLKVVPQTVNNWPGLSQVISERLTALAVNRRNRIYNETDSDKAFESLFRSDDLRVLEKTDVYTTGSVVAYMADSYAYSFVGDSMIGLIGQMNQMNINPKALASPWRELLANSRSELKQDAESLRQKGDAIIQKRTNTLSMSASLRALMASNI